MTRAIRTLGVALMASATATVLARHSPAGLGAPIDFDGDGTTDWAVVRNTGGGPSGAVTWYWQGGQRVSGRVWGVASDFFVPADYDGDGRSDFAVQRNTGSGGAVFHVMRSGGAGYLPVPWGAPSDVIVPGDYDGDGKTDIGLWRPNADPARTTFSVRWSSDGSVHDLQFGRHTDYPIANFNTH